MIIVKKAGFFLLATLFILLCSVNVCASFDIEDPTLLEVMKQYDLNGDGIIGVNEFNAVMLSEGRTLTLDNNSISSVKGLEKAIYADKIFMRNCGFYELPDGIDNLHPKELHLENNNLTNADDLFSLINKRDGLKNFVFIEGNPCAEEVIYKDFNYRFYNLSIVGAVGETYWQKTNNRSELKVDSMDAGIIDEVTWYDTVIAGNDFSKMEWEFSIEDESIARIEGESLLERDFEFDPVRYASTCIETLNEYRHQTDPIITLKLLKEGRTRMKITCGDYVKYTDIIVLPEHTSECGLYAMPNISDLEMLKPITKYTEPTYSGIYRNAYDYYNKKHLVLDGSEAFIKDMSSFTDMDKIERLTFSTYTEDMFKQVSGIKDIPNLYYVEIYKNGADETSELYQYINDSISTVKGTGWITIEKKNRIEARLLDVNNDERVTARDALSVLLNSAELLELDEKQEKIADLNDDDKVNAEDALEILKAIAKVK